MAKIVVTVKKERNRDNLIQEPGWIEIARTGGKDGLPVYVHPKLEEYMSYFGVVGSNPLDRDRSVKDYIAIVPVGFSMDQVRLQK